MPKIQGKQIAESTITQELLNLTTPLSGDTQAAATVDYVNEYVTSVSGSTVIGPAEDGTYTDGIFTDFTESTRIGVAVDRFNEMLLLLAPAPPSTNWDSVFSNLNITSTEYTGNEAGTGTARTQITVDSTPNFGMTVTIPPTEGLNGDTGTFTMNGPSGQLDQVILTTGDDTTSGIISLTESDPYDGEAGKAGFWSGITAMSVSGTLPSITPGTTLRNINFVHTVGSGSPETYNFYVENTLSTATVTAASATFPTMTSYVSGVPGLATGASVSAIAFTVNNAVGYFYRPTIYSFSGSNITNVGDTAPSVVPSANSSFSETGKSTTISSGYAESISFSIGAKNLAGTAGTAAIVSSGVYRIDTVSNETSRLLSAAGSYPATGWGGAFVSTTSLKTGAYVNEMMLIGGTYKYPAGDFTTYVDATTAGPDYSTGISGTRWATFNLGSFTNNGSFTLTINGASSITSVGQANLLIEVQISGQTSWVDADAYYAGVGDPGSGANGVAAVVNGYTGSSATVRRITFGAITYTGAIMVRIGFTGTGPQFTSLSASAIV